MIINNIISIMQHAQEDVETTEGQNERLFCQLVWVIVLCGCMGWTEASKNLEALCDTLTKGAEH